MIVLNIIQQSPSWISHSMCPQVLIPKKMVLLRLNAMHDGLLVSSSVSQSISCKLFWVILLTVECQKGRKVAEGRIRGRGG